MCISSLNAILSKTYIGVWDVKHPHFGYRHVMAYQNSPKNLAAENNCMLLHIPSKQPLQPTDIIDTSKDLDFLTQMANSVVPFSRNLKAVPAGQSNFVVEMGIYHLALLNDCSDEAFTKVINKIPETKRPKITRALVDFYNQTFPDWPLLLCCFNNQDAKLASPIMLHFDSKYPDIFMFPTLEAHGHVPILEEKIEFHQTIIAGSYQIKQEGNGWKAFNREGISEKLLPWLPRYGDGFSLVDQYLPNLDFLADARLIRTGGDAAFELGILS